jgi:hypothetical protein
MDGKGVIEVGGKPMWLKDLTVDRRLSFHISVASGDDAGPVKFVEAQQHISIVDGQLVGDASYFVMGKAAQGLKDWPGAPEKVNHIAFPIGQEVYPIVD